MPDFLGIPRIGNLAQTLQQHRQHRPIHLDLLTDRLQTPRSFFLLILVRTCPIGQTRAGRHTQSLLLLTLTQVLLSLLTFFPLLLDRFPIGAAAGLCYGSTLPCNGPPHSRSRKSSHSALT